MSDYLFDLGEALETYTGWDFQLILRALAALLDSLPGEVYPDPTSPAAVDDLADTLRPWYDRLTRRPA